MHKKCIFIMLSLATSFSVANVVLLDSSIQQTSNGNSIQLRLPDGINAHVLYWSDIPDTAFDLVLKYDGDVYYWGVGGAKMTFLRVPVTQTQTWLFANFFGKHISFSGVNDTNLFRIKGSQFGREITVSSNDTIYWHLCSGLYACDFMPPVVADLMEGTRTAKDPGSARSAGGRSFEPDNAASSRETSEDSSTTVRTLGSLIAVLILIIFGLVLFSLFKMDLNFGKRDEVAPRAFENTPKIDDEMV